MRDQAICVDNMQATQSSCLRSIPLFQNRLALAAFWGPIILPIYNPFRISPDHADLVLREADTFPTDRNFVHEAI